MCFAMCVRLSVRVEQLGSYWKDFHEIWYLSFFKYVEKIQVSLKFDKNDGNLWISIYTLIISL
jgi:hypothetical protein